MSLMIDNDTSAGVGVGVIPGRKLLSAVKPQQHPSSLCPEILMLVLNYLDKEELLNCKLVCRDWSRWIALTEPMSSASTVFSIPHVVEKIFEKLNHKERLESRLISESFNLVAAKYLHLAPILTDITSKSILSIGSNLHVEEIKTSSLYINLPTTTTTDGILVDCAFDRSKVKSLTFYEGVIRSNKQVLLQSFPHIEHLKYMSSTNFLLYENLNYTFLKKLEITTSLYDENGNLRSFFSNAKFPVLETLELSIQARLDFLLYLEVHYFITVHLERLKKLILIFGTDFIFAGLEVAKIFRNLPTHINERWLQVLNVIENNTNSIDCRLKFLRCEGISKFRLSISLYDNLKSLNPDALILYDTPDEDNMDLEDEEDDGDDDDDVEDEDFENPVGEGAFPEENNQPGDDFIFDADFMGFNEGEDNTDTDSDSENPENEGNDDDDDDGEIEIGVYGLPLQGNDNAVDIDNFLNAWEHEPDSQGEDDDDDDDEDDEFNLVLEAFDEDAYVNEDDEDHEAQGLELELEILPPLPQQCYEQEDSPDDDMEA